MPIHRPSLSFMLAAPLAAVASSILLTLSVFPAASVAEGAERPNILFIMSDDKYD